MKHFHISLQRSLKKIYIIQRKFAKTLIKLQNLKVNIKMQKWTYFVRIITFSLFSYAFLTIFLERNWEN